MKCFFTMLGGPFHILTQVKGLALGTYLALIVPFVSLSSAVQDGGSVLSK